MLHRGAGAYICGEETGLLDSLEGKRGNPRLKPPFPANQGLYQGPTLINNVETLATVPHIIRMGGAEYAKLGTETSTGTKLVSVCGNVQRPGNYEIELGIPSREIVYGLAGGPERGREIKLWFPGGSSSPVLPPGELDLPYDFDSMAKAGSMLGSGAIIVVDDSRPVVDVALKLAKFYRHESCGKCTPCREGTNWTVKMLQRVEAGEATPMDLDIIASVQEQIIGNCLCVLGDAMAMPVGSMVAKFRDEFEAHIEARAAQRLGLGAPREPTPLERRVGARRRSLMPRPEVRMVTFSIDGREVQAPEGAMLVDGAKYGDVEIPVFCYEPKLGQPVGACRMCLVEIEGIPKLQTACSTPVKDGMVVHTQTERVREAQSSVVEFLLVNHPLDCPVCDKGGECPLQDITFGWGRGISRMVEPKRHFKKPLELSPLIAIDRERCILCYRCVRFSQEVSEDYQLILHERGAHSYVGTFDAHPYVAPFSGNIIELCPVGALTSRAVPLPRAAVGRRGRRHGLHAVPVAVQRRADGARRAGAARARARPRRGRRRLAVRQGPLRVPGVHAEERMVEPLVRDGDELRPASWERASSGRGALGRARGSVGALAGGDDHQRGGLPAAAARARGARLERPRLARWAARSPLDVQRALAAPALQATVAGPGVRARRAGARHRAGRRRADPRPADPQGRAPAAACSSRSRRRGPSRSTRTPKLWLRYAPGARQAFARGARGARSRRRRDVAALRAAPTRTRGGPRAGRAARAEAAATS